jgi:16S rRNA (cytidine1402-2'-O)-methyltransferase
MQSGLYIVGTPIGNLSDMSPRAIETLRQADLIAAEDTRVFAKLGDKFDIRTKRIAMHDHNEKEIAKSLADQIEEGKVIACVSDSGMPGISDPGFPLVRECRQRGLKVFVVPGPAAVTSALVLSGFPTDRFTFGGFLPHNPEAMLRRDNKIRHTIVYYESPARVMDTIKMMAKVFPERKIAIVREMTKLHEETIIGYPSELVDMTPPRGEIVIVVAPAPELEMSESEINDIVRDVVAHCQSTKEAAAIIAERTGISRSDAYERVIKK